MHLYINNEDGKASATEGEGIFKSTAVSKTKTAEELNYLTGGYETYLEAMLMIRTVDEIEYIRSREDCIKEKLISIYLTVIDEHFNTLKTIREDRYQFIQRTFCDALANIVDYMCMHDLIKIDIRKIG